MYQPKAIFEKDRMFCKETCEKIALPSLQGSDLGNVYIGLMEDLLAEWTDRYQVQKHNRSLWVAVLRLQLLIHNNNNNLKGRFLH